MKFLSVADLHYTLKQWDWVVSAADRYELVVLPGDLLDLVSPVEFDVQILIVRKYLRKLVEKTKVLICSGNHDLTGESEAGERVADWMQELRDLGVLVDGDHYRCGDILFSLCPWWEGDDSKAAIEAILERDAAEEKTTWFWLYHGPPEGSKLAWDGKRSFGDTPLLNWMKRYQPDFVLGGHIHQAPFVRDGIWWDRIGESLAFNAGKQIGPQPCSIEFDTDAGTALWQSLAGVEALDLKTDVVSVLA
ncbi:MAG: metallophosphoesterase family protein [Opitutaceae bacterium]